MKRSQMVLFLAEMMVEPRHEDPMDQASFMLKKLEEKGMSPPSRRDEANETELAVYIQEWESE